MNRLELDLEGVVDHPIEVRFPSMTQIGARKSVSIEVLDADEGYDVSVRLGEQEMFTKNVPKRKVEWVAKTLIGEAMVQEGNRLSKKALSDYEKSSN